MTEDEWVNAYAERSGVDPVRLLERRAARGQRPGPCACGDPICEGWAWTDDEVMLENLAPEADLVPHPFQVAVDWPDLCHTCGQTATNPLHHQDDGWTAGGLGAVYGPCPGCDNWTLEVPPPWHAVPAAVVEAIMAEHAAECPPLRALADARRPNA